MPARKCFKKLTWLTGCEDFYADTRVCQANRLHLSYFRAHSSGHILVLGSLKEALQGCCSGNVGDRPLFFGKISVDRGFFSGQKNAVGFQPGCQVGKKFLGRKNGSTEYLVENYIAIYDRNESVFERAFDWCQIPIFYLAMP